MTARLPCGRGGGATPPQRRCAADAPPVHDAWASASEPERETALNRLAAVREVESLVDVGLSLLEADRAAAAAAGVSAAIVGRWRRRVAGLAKGERAAALLDRKRTGRPARMTAGQVATLEALAFHHGPHLTAEHARRVLEARHGAAPSRRHVRGWLARWRDANVRDLSAVVNPGRHRSRRKPALGLADTAGGLNALWELDSTIADVMCADGKRRALVAAIDVWSRRAMFLVAPTSRASAIAALLRRCILEWGVPDAIRTDEGRDYTSAHVVSVLEALEIEHQRCRPYHPEDKPFVERLIGTVSRDLFAFLPGFTGHSPADAQALRERTSFAGRRGQSPMVTLGADLDPDDLQDRLDAWAETLYGRRGHSGLNGASPFEKAVNWPGEIRRVNSERALDALLAPPVKGGGTRVVDKDGVPVGGIHYIAPELGSLIRQRVAVRVIPGDAGRVFVFECLEGRAGPFVCVARDPALPDVDQAEIAARAGAIAAEADRSARGRARTLIRAERPGEAMDEVLASTSEDAGRVVMLPRKGVAHETPALAAADEAARAAGAGGAAGAIPSAPARRSRAVMAAAHRLFLEDTDDDSC